MIIGNKPVKVKTNRTHFTVVPVDLTVHELHHTPDAVLHLTIYVPTTCPKQKQAFLSI